MASRFKVRLLGVALALVAVPALAAEDTATARREIAAAIASFQDFATEALFSLPSSLDVAGTGRGRHRRQTGPAMARPDRPQQQGDIT